MNPVWKHRSSCPACNHADHEVVADLPYDTPPISEHLTAFYPPTLSSLLASLRGSRFRVARCQACATHFQSHAPDPQWLAAFYNALPSRGNRPPANFRVYAAQPRTRDDD